jgi:hypothetical protein
MHHHPHPQTIGDADHFHNVKIEEIRRMSEPDTSRDIPQALWAERGVIIVAPAAQPEPEPEGEPEAGA